MDKLNRILKEKKLQGKTWSDLADGLPVSGEGLRIAFNRKSVSEDDVIKMSANNVNRLIKMLEKEIIEIKETLNEIKHSMKI